jgi:hypothetical protein
MVVIMMEGRYKNGKDSAKILWFVAKIVLKILDMREKGKGKRKSF